MSIGQRYQSSQLRSDGYDAVIIGSGMGGMTCAALLAKEGKRVLVLEKHYTAGGFTHAFRRKNYEWDIGLHYIGEVHSKRSLLRRAFDDLSEDRLEWAPMDPAYDQAYFPDQRYDFKAGFQQFRESMLGYFPQEKSAIDKYLATVKDATKQANGFFALKALPPLVARLAGPFLQRKFFHYSDRTVTEVMKSCGLSDKAIGVLTCQWGDYGLPPSQASFMIHAMIAKHYFGGASYPVGGGASIARSIIPTIEKSGGAVMVRAHVKEIVVHKGRAVGVRMRNGDEIHAPIIISNAGVFNTYTKLLSTQDASQLDARVHKSLSKNLSSVSPSLSHICLYLGINRPDICPPTGNGNQWIFPSYNHDQNFKSYIADLNRPFPVVYISYPSSKDPTWQERYPGRSTMEIISFVPYERFKNWEQTRWYNRGEEYLAYKNLLIEKLLDVAYRYNPNLKGAIDYQELSTPLSTKHFCEYEHGEIYGINHDPDRFRQRWLRPQSPIKNLYLTGQDVASNGIGGALFSGVLTASVLLRRNVIKDILARTKV